MFLLLLKLHLKKQVLPIARPESRAEKRKWLRHCPAASNVGSSAPSFKVIGEKLLVLIRRLPGVLRPRAIWALVWREILNPREVHAKK